MEAFLTYGIIGLSTAAIYAIVGISLNILVGYTGQLSLGHQGFLGVGSITAANLVTTKKLPFTVAASSCATLGRKRSASSTSFAAAETSRAASPAGAFEPTSDPSAPTIATSRI